MGWKRKPRSGEGGENRVGPSSRPLHFPWGVNQKIVTWNRFDSIFTRSLIYFFISFAGIGLYILVIEYFFRTDSLG